MARRVNGVNKFIKCLWKEENKMYTLPKKWSSWTVTDWFYYLLFECHPGFYDRLGDISYNAKIAIEAIDALSED